MGSLPNATQGQQGTEAPLTPEQQRLRSMSLRQLILEGRQFASLTAHTPQTLRRLIHPDIPHRVRRTGNVAFLQEYENFRSIERELARRDPEEVRTVNDEIRRAEDGMEVPQRAWDGFIIDPYPAPVERPNELGDPLSLWRLEILEGVMESVGAFQRRRLREDEEWMAEARRTNAALEEMSIRQREMEERRRMVSDVHEGLQRLRQAVPAVELDPQSTLQPEEQQESQVELVMVHDASRSVSADTFKGPPDQTTVVEDINSAHPTDCGRTDHIRGEPTIGLTLQPSSGTTESVDLNFWELLALAPAMGIWLLWDWLKGVVGNKEDEEQR